VITAALGVRDNCSRRTRTGLHLSGRFFVSFGMQKIYVYPDQFFLLMRDREAACFSGGWLAELVSRWVIHRFHGLITGEFLKVNLKVKPYRYTGG